MAATITHAPGPLNEGAILAAFEREGLSASQWSNGPQATYVPHSHTYHKVLYCLRGSIIFRVEATGQDFALRPGDRLDIEPGTVHSAVVGPEGVVCVEAPRP